MPNPDNIPLTDKRKGAYAGKTNLTLLKRRILHVINTEVVRMVKRVNAGELEKKDQEAIIKYGKFVDELVKEMEESVKDVADEDLRKSSQD